MGSCPARHQSRKSGGEPGKRGQPPHPRSRILYLTCSGLPLAGQVRIWLPVLSMARHRDLFPLPLPHSSTGSLDPNQSLHTHLRRTHGGNGLKRWANEGVLALNALYGCRPSPGAPTFLQRGVLDEISSKYTSLGAPPADLTAVDAFKDLAAAAVPYSSGGGAPVPFQPGLTSLPDIGFEATPSRASCPRRIFFG